MTTSTWSLLCERAFCRLFKDNFADLALASDLGDVEPCRIEVLQRFSMWVARGWFVASRQAISDISWAQCLPTLLCLAARLAGPQARKRWGAGEDLLVVFPWLGDAFDKKHGFEAPSADDGEAVHAGAEPSDEVLGHAMASLHAARVALSDGQEGTQIRCPHSRSRSTRNSGCNWLRP